ncbi:verrucotoxin subunit beta-like [Clarias gariepinus]|uniref:verrucotoxin subunit beta-like n=1 Tax=Clarias gariepinus TaxID=13013 RepID=UPI00234C839C|nr:verrucotoxin subunit beta-like [Clarias gariepinus]
MTIVDPFSKSVHLVPLPKLPSAKKTTELLVLHVFRLHGLPTDIVSNQGPQFTSRFWGAFCRLVGATPSLSSGFHPQSNGQTERMNQALEVSLRCMTTRDWSKFLPWVEYAHNSLPSASTGLSPFQGASPVVASPVSQLDRDPLITKQEKGPTQRLRAPLQDFRVGAPMERMGVNTHSCGRDFATGEQLSDVIYPVRLARRARVVLHRDRLASYQLHADKTSNPVEAGLPQDNVCAHPSPAKGLRRFQRQCRPPSRLRDGVRHGITLWNQEQLQQNRDVNSQVNTEFTVTTSDTIIEKSKHLKVDGELKLSLLGGNVQPSGAARYFNDTKKSFKQKRLTLHYRTTCRFEQLTMNHLAQGRMDHHEVFVQNVATHVVTAVLYGADAYFVFDREVNLSEQIKDVQGEMKVALDKLKVLCDGGASIDLNMNENETAAVKHLSCTFYGDFMLPSNPTTFEGAMKVYAGLPELLGQNGEHAVPIKVWLYPLVKLNSSAGKLERNITPELIRAVESVIEALNVTDMKCDDLLEDTVAKTFNTFYDRVQDFQKFCSEYKQDFMKKLGSLLPEIRGGRSDINAMNKLIEAHEKSPFKTKHLEQWITKKEKESNQVKALMKQLHELGAEVTDDVDKYLLDLDVETVVAFAFTCLQYSDLLLGNQEIYLKNPSENKIGQVFQNKSWTSNDLMCMKNNLKVFKDLITLNKSQNTKFIVQSLPQTSNDECSCILMYECIEAVRFVPPSKPKCPNLESVTDNSIAVKLSPPCAATLERKLLYKMKQENNWKVQPVNQDRVTLTDLKEGTDYEIKCGTLGKLEYMVESDAITVKTTCSAVNHQRDLKSKSESNQHVSGNKPFKCFNLLTGKTLNSHNDLMHRLKKQVPDLQVVQTEAECDIILVFCSIVRGPEHDIKAALEKLYEISDTKPAVMVVFHHAFDPPAVVPDSSRAVSRGNIITVDCLFHEDQGLLQCQKNEDSLTRIVTHIKSQVSV